MKPNLKSAIRFALAVTTIVGVAPFALAYAAANDNVTVLDEIVVTALKRESTLQETPAAVAALDANSIQQRGISGVEDLQMQTPSLSFGKTQGVTIINIRGIGLNEFTGATDPGVSVHVDGVYQPRPAMGDLAQMDLQRIEVLRGPQGTLYGRNATGGAVNFITSAPTSEFAAYAQGSFEQYDEWHVQGMVNTPLSDSVRARVTVNYADREQGFIKNIVPGNPDLDKFKSFSGRVRLGIDLSDTATLDVSLFGGHESGSNTYLTLSNPVNGGALFLNPYLIGAKYSLEPRKTGADLDTDLRRNVSGVAATVNWDLGAVKLKSISSYTSFAWHLINDADGTNLPMFVYNRQDESKTYTEELNLSGKTGNFDWLTGAFFMNDTLKLRSHFDFPLGLNIGIGLLMPGGILEATLQPARTQSIAGFGDTTYHVNDHLSLIAGARYSKDEKNYEQTVQTGPTNFGLVTVPVSPLCGNAEFEPSYSAFTPRAGLQYQFNADRNVYVTVSRGFKSGGLNYSSCGNLFKPEEITSYETGFKSRFAEGRANLGVSAFYYDYTDLQLFQIVNLEALINNAPAATVKGLELEGSIVPNDHWLLSAGVTLLDATYKEFSNLDSLNLAAGVQNLSGNHLNYAPDWSGNLALQYRSAAIGSGSHITARAESHLTAKYYLREFNAAEDAQGGYGIANLYLIWDSAQDKYTTRLFLKNVTDKAYFTSMGASSNFGSRYVEWNSPRQLGVEFRARF